LKKKLKIELKTHETQAVICYDFQKNLPMPVTNVSVEYYLRKFYCYNFGIRDLKTNNVSMFLYPQNFGKKGSNEVISFIDFYINQVLDSKVKVLHIFSDNCFSQNKNKFLWAYYKTLVVTKKLEKIVIYYPIPGHSLMEIDGDFGRIEISKKNYERIYHPSEYAQIIKNTDIENSINVIGVNFSLFDNSLIAKVFDYKRKFSSVLRNQLNHCSTVRQIIFTENDTKISLSLKNACENSLEIFKPKYNQKSLLNYLEDIQLAYDKCLPLSREQLYDVLKIVEFIPNSVSKNFYKTLYTLDSTEINNNQKSLHKLFDKNNQKSNNKK
jgi:hypothetical protein